MSRTHLRQTGIGPGRYRHFKGGEYEVLDVGRHTETNEWVVLYRSLQQPETIWVRPLEMFTEVVEQPDGSLPRFVPAESVRRRTGGIPALAAELLTKVARKIDTRSPHSSLI